MAEVGDRNPPAARRKCACAGETDARRASSRRRTGSAGLRMLACWILLTGGHGPCVAQVPDIAELADRVRVDSYRNYLQDDLYAHDGDDRSCQGTQRELAMERIRERFASFGLVTLLGSPFTACGRMHYNVVGIHTGVICPQEIYIVGAHYDSADGSPGAWDNASGVAGVLEAARVLSQRPFEATIIFIAFDGEERGRKGSRAYAEEHRFDRIRAMISLDGIAYRPYQSDNPDHSKVGLYYVTRHAQFVDDLCTSMRAYGHLTCVVDQEDLTDNLPFDQMGFAAAALIAQGLHCRPSFMHTPMDSVDTAGWIDYEYGTQVTRGAVGYLASYARPAAARARPDLDGDGLVDMRDYALLARRWGPNRSRLDLSPAAAGEDAVGFAELTSLSYYWLNRWSGWWPGLASCVPEEN